MKMDTTTFSAIINSTLTFDNDSIVTNVTTLRPRLPGTPPPVGHYGDIRIKLWEILPPIIMTWGILGNILSVIILFRIARRTSITSTTLYLTALAISDTIILLCGPLRNWILVMWEEDVRDYNDASCKSQLYFTYFSGHLSSWILVAITLERVVSVVSPHKVRIGCTPKNAMITIFILVFVLGGMGLVHPIIQRLESGRGAIKCSPYTEEYLRFRDDVYVWLDMLITAGIPFVCLLIGNIIIVIQLRKSRIRQKSMQVSRGGGGKSTVRDTRSLSILLIFLSVIFLLTMTPLYVFTIYYKYRYNAILKMEDRYEQWYAYQYILYQHAIVNLVGYTNASFNFVLYVLTGSKFRQELKDMFRCKGKQKKSDATSTPGTSKTPVSQTMSVMTTSSAVSADSDTDKRGISLDQKNGMVSASLEEPPTDVVDNMDDGRLTDSHTNKIAIASNQTNGKVSASIEESPTDVDDNIGDGHVTDICKSAEKFSNLHAQAISNSMILTPGCMIVDILDQFEQ